MGRNAILIAVMLASGPALPAGLNPEVDRALREALVIVLSNTDGSITAQDRPVILSSIATARLEGNDIDGARKIARLDPYLSDSFSFRFPLAVAQAKSGKRKDSLETFGRISTDLDSLPATRPAGVGRALTLVSLAAAQEEAGDKGAAQATRARAKRAIGDIAGDGLRGSTAYHKAKVLAAMSVELSRAGDFHGAIRLLSEIPNEADGLASQLKSEALRDIGMMQVKGGDLRGALKTLAINKDDTSRARTCLWIYDQTVNVTRKSEAIRLIRAAADAAQRIGDYRDRGMILAEVALAQAELGERDAARATLEVARSLSADSPLGKAFSSVFGLSDRTTAHHQWKAALLAKCSLVYGKLGDQVAVSSVLQDAQQLAERISDPTESDLARSVIAACQSKIGDREGAWKNYLAMNESKIKTNLLYVIVCDMAKSGDFPGASRSIETLADGPLKVRVAANCAELVAMTIASSGNLGQALKWAESRKTSLDRARALVGAVRGLGLRDRGDRDPDLSAPWLY